MKNKIDPIIYYLFVYPLMGLAALSFISFSIVDFLPNRAIFDGFFFLSAILVVFSAAKKPLAIQLGLFLFVVVSYFLMMVFFDGRVLDFLQIYKSYIYMFCLMGFVGRKIFSSTRIAQIFKILLVCFLIKYILWNFIGDVDRPRFYGENNFELMFLLLLYIVLNFFDEPIETIYLVIMIAIFLMSGSRSGLAALMFFLAVVNIKRFDFKLLLGAVLFGFLSIIVFNIFESRMNEGGFEALDRVRFFNYFLLDIDNWGVGNYLFGTAPITPMTDMTCAALVYYEALFSYHEQGVCYSVVLHGYNLRMIYDHGIVGFGLIFMIVIYCLRYSGWSGRYILAFMGTVFLTGLSVSSLNNYFIISALMVAVSSYKNELRAT